MGFNYWALVATQLSLSNLSIKSACSFGRQVIHIHDFDKLGPELEQLGLTKYSQNAGSGSLPYADESFFPDQGVELSSIDYSDYEQADIITDLSCRAPSNQTIRGLSGRFDAVFDIGTSEHVGDPFSSIYNAFELLRDGGYYFFDLPYSGWLNHGLIQFCPSYFAELARTNGHKLLFQFMHPTCRQGVMVFARDNVNYFPGCITSIFGCIQKKSSSEQTLKPPVQTFCNITGEMDYSLVENITGEENMPLLNQVSPDEFISYMMSSRQFEMYWSSWNKAEKIGQRNLYMPRYTYSGMSQVVF